MKFLPLLLTTVAAFSARADDWPQFRGNNASGIAPDKGLPDVFSTTSNLAWRAKVGEGIGSPIIVNGRLYTTAISGEQTCSLICLDAGSGRELWRTSFETGPLPRITPPNSHASSSPASDGKRIFIHFSTIGILAFDANSGAELWRHAMPKPAYLMDWGAAASPIVWKDTVVFCQDDDLSPFLLCLDASTGRQRWKTRRDEMLAGYATPVLCEAEGRTDLVIAGSGKLKGYDPDTGAEIWTCNTLLRTIMTSPVVDRGVIYLAVQSYGDSTRTLKHALLQWLDTNQDGVLTRAEVPKEFHERFDASDRNKDGVLGPDELDTAFQSPNNMAAGGNIIQAIRGGGRGDVTKTHVVWNLDHKTPSNIASPLFFNDRLYLVKSGGLSSCYDARDGRALWERTRLGNLGDYYASPVAADGKVYIAGRNGFVLTLKDGPQLEVLARNDLGEEIIATPAIANGRIFFRSRESVFCISNPAAPRIPAP